MDIRHTEVLVQDRWEVLPREVREEFFARRVQVSDSGGFGRPGPGKRWAALRPIVLDEAAYRLLETIVARSMRLAVEACQRRVATLGELHRALRFRDELPLMDPDSPLVAAELTSCVRPDVLIEQGRPRIVELNVGTRIGGGTNAPRWAQRYARLVPEAGLRPPRSTVAARSEAMLRVLDGQPDAKLGVDKPRRLAIPSYWTLNDSGGRQHNKKVKKSILAEVHRVGFDVVQPDLDQLQLDAEGCLVAADEPIDLVLVQWGCNEFAYMVDERAGLAALRAADQAGTVTVFPRTESALMNSKAILGWLHEDCDAGLLTPADGDLVRTYIPRTTALGLDTPSGASTGQDVPDSDEGRGDMVVKPALGKAGNGVLFGSQTSPRDWHNVAVDAPAQAPVVLQQRVIPDRVTMAFLDIESGQRTTAAVPFLLSPFLIDGAAADVSVRHMLPGVADHDVVISVDRGGCWNTVVLLPDQPNGRP